MARGTTFGQLIEMTRIEAGVDPDPALSLNTLPLFKRLIQREYERLYDEFDAPFLRVIEDKLTQAGQRYYDIPTSMSLETIEKVEYRWSDQWIPLRRGITVDNYVGFDSDNDIRHEPAMAWDVRYTAAAEQIEIWPIPVADDRKIRFTGKLKFVQLINNEDRCLLDDQMVSMFAAAEYLASRQSAEAPLKQEKAVARMRMVRGRSIQTPTNSFNFGGKREPDLRDLRGPLVAYVDRT